MTSLDGYTLEDDPDNENMIDESSFFSESLEDEDLGGTSEEM